MRQDPWCCTPRIQAHPCLQSHLGRRLGSGREGAPNPGGQLEKEIQLWDEGSPPPGRAEGVSRLCGDLELLVPAGEDLFSLQLVKQVSLVFSPL